MALDSRLKVTTDRPISDWPNPIEPNALAQWGTFPYATITGLTCDSGDYEAAADESLWLFDRDKPHAAAPQGGFLHRRATWAG